jgi:2'-5' RNA ligase
MPIAISVKAANETASKIRALWEQASRFEDQSSMHALAYPPHITLAIYDDIERDEVISALDAAFLGKSVFRIAFNGLRYFEATPFVLWAEPTFCSALNQAHAKLHDLIDPALCRAHYRPDAWVPHCTLATQVKSDCLSEALEFANRAIKPFEVVFDTADCVNFPPVAIIKECALLSI